MIAAAAVAAGFTLYVIGTRLVGRCDNGYDRGLCDGMVFAGLFLVVAGCVALVAA